MMNKLALGTVQFGMKYGINNRYGQTLKQEVFKILNYALKNNINFLDTAYDYGDSEHIIGEYIRHNENNFKIISKLPTVKLDNVDDIIQTSLKRLHIQTFYGYLFHDFKSFLKTPKILERLKKYKKKGLIKKIGFSIYYPRELEYLLKNKVDFDLVQFPYSVFDQRFDPYLSLIKKQEKEIHIRSVFLQGLVFMNPNKLPVKIRKIKKKLELLKRMSQELNMPVSAICLNFATINSRIDRVVIGVDNKKNLEEDVGDLRFSQLVKKHYNKLINLKEFDENIILPFNWNKIS